MKSRRIAAFSGIAIAFYLLGVWTAPAFRMIGPSGSSVTGMGRPPQNSGISQEDSQENTAPGKFRSHERPGPEEGQIAISRKSIKNLIAGKSFRGWDYRGLGDHAADVLTVLGATEEEQRAAGTYFETAANELRVKEKELAKVTQPDPAKIHIDLAAVRGPAVEIVRNLQNNLRSTLPGATADLLISSIKWDDYYIPGGETSVTLTLKQNTDGRTWGDVRSTTGYHGQSISTYLEPSDGSPVSAGAVFRQWAPLVGDLRIAPLSRKE